MLSAAGEEETRGNVAQTTLNPLTSIKGIISPKEALELLSTSYLNTLILDVCKEPCLSIAGSKYLKWVSLSPKPASSVPQRSPNNNDDDIITDGEDSDTASVATSSTSASRDSALFDVGNGFARAEGDAWNQDLFNLRRVPIHVLVYDEDGFGHASSVVEWLSEQGNRSLPSSSCISVQRIQGGIDAFLKEFPLLDKRIEPSTASSVPSQPSSTPIDTIQQNNGAPSPPRHTTIVIDQPEDTLHYLELLHKARRSTEPSEEKAFLGSLFGLPGPSPLESLKLWQKNLIDSVWFGKKDGDVPVPILPDFLYLSSCFACTRQNLVSNGIKHVVRLGWGFHTLVEKEGAFTLINLTYIDNITFHDFRISDSPSQPIRQVLEETGSLIDEIHRKGEKVLVHCHAGVSRSSSVVLAYLMKFRQMSLYDSWNLTYKARPIIRPNYGFARALQAYEVDLFDRDEPTLHSFWMSESYMGYLDYVEFMYRTALTKLECIPKFMVFGGGDCGNRNKLPQLKYIMDFKGFEKIEGQQTMHEKLVFEDPLVESVQLKFIPSTSTDDSDAVFVSAFCKKEFVNTFKGTLLCIHGIDGYGSFWPRYSLYQFLDAGYRVVYPDLPAFGRTSSLYSPSTFGFVSDIDVYSRTIDQLINELIVPSQPESKSKLYLVSISLGGMHLVNYFHDHHLKKQVDGLVFISPALRLSPESKPSALLEFGVRALLAIAPSFGNVEAPSKGVKGNICPDPQFEIDFYADPLNYHGNVKMGTGKAILDSFARIEERMKAIDIPILILHGTLDIATSFLGSELFFETAESKDKTFLVYENVEHIIFHERPASIQDIVNWVDERLGSPTLNCSLRKSIPGDKWIAGSVHDSAVDLVE